MRAAHPSPDDQIQSLDVHLEALLRSSHSIQRALLKLRAEAPPPAPAPANETVRVLRNHAQQMRRDCQMLSGIVEDLSGGIESLAKKS
jgi:hypothetical protein